MPERRLLFHGLQRYFFWCKNFQNKFGNFEKVVYLCSPFPRGRHEDHWKYWKISTSKYRETKNRERWFLWKLIECQDRLRSIKIYKEEFDPGSGWTLAAGLTHASRGAARGSNTLAATGERVRNAWATCPYPGHKRWKRRLISHNNRSRMTPVWKIRRIRMSSRDIS